MIGRSIAIAYLALTAAGWAGSASTHQEPLSWSAAQAEAIGRQTYRKGRVGGFWDSRKLKTERAYNYKLAATWMTPEVIRATARLIQLRSRLTDGDAQSLIKDADRRPERS